MNTNDDASANLKVATDNDQSANELEALLSVMQGTYPVAKAACADMNIADTYWALNDSIINAAIAAINRKRTSAPNQDQGHNTNNGSDDSNSDNSSSANLYWTITNATGYQVDINFTLIGTNLGWPGHDRIWKIDNDRSRQFDLSCSKGQKICFGANTSFDYTVQYWGMGVAHEHGCKGCCQVCTGESAKASNRLIP